MLAFRFPDGFGLGLGTIVLWINAALLSLFSLLLQFLPAYLRRIFEFIPQRAEKVQNLDFHQPAQ